MSARIREALGNGWDVLFQDELPAPDNQQVETLQLEIERVNQEATTLVTELRKAPPELTSIFHKQMKETAAELRTLQAALQKAEAEKAVIQQASDSDALGEFNNEEDIAALWQKDTTEINAVLRRLMGNRRIAVADGLIIGTRFA